MLHNGAALPNSSFRLREVAICCAFSLHCECRKKQIVKLKLFDLFFLEEICLVSM